tara:strand:+ start:459 stop:617 length:159 start_codon:yes stop_codon:yes gene_type:complete
MVTTFVDYEFKKDNDSIIFDAELTPQHLDVVDGDEFMVVVVENRIILKKKVD